MTPETLERGDRDMTLLSTFKKSWMLKSIAFLGVLLIIAAGGILYAKHQLIQWLEEKKIAVEVKNVTPFWKGIASPFLEFEHLKLSFKDPKAVAKTIEISKVIVGFNTLFTLKSFFFAFEFPFELNDLRIKLQDKGYIKSKKVSGKLIQKRDYYSLNEISIEPFQFGFKKFSPEKDTLSHLIIYQIDGNMGYEMSSQKIIIDVSIPPAMLQMPEGKTYSVSVKGEIKLISNQRRDVPLEGKLCVKIWNVSNFLSHLHQIGIISFLEANLGTIMQSLYSKQDALKENLKEKIEKIFERIDS